MQLIVWDDYHSVKAKQGRLNVFPVFLFLTVYHKLRYLLDNGFSVLYCIFPGSTIQKLYSPEGYNVRTFGMQYYIPV